MSKLPINLRWSEIKSIICGPDLYNLQTRKKSEQVETVRIDLSIKAILKGNKYKLMLKLMLNA